MPVVNVNLVLDDKTYAGVMSGVLEHGGLVKDVSSHRSENTSLHTLV